MTRISRTIRIVSALVLLLALGLLAACAGEPADPSSAGSGAQAGSAAPAVRPTIQLLTPQAGATVPAGTVAVTVETTDIEIVMPSGGNVPGQGHVHFTLDDRPYEMSIEKGFEFDDVEPGPHTLKAELVQNDTSSFDPPVEQEIEFTVE